METTSDVNVVGSSCWRNPRTRLLFEREREKKDERKEAVLVLVEVTKVKGSSR
jgi:hypothetical protein